MRTLDEIMQAQNVTMPDLLKAAALNAAHMPATFERGAQLVAEVLTADADEVKLLHNSIILNEAIAVAQAADDAYSVAVSAAGYKSRWHYDHKVLRAPSPLRDAYDAKVSADDAVHAAFKLCRDTNPRF